MRGNISSGDHFHNIQFPEVVGVAQGSVGQLTPPKLRRFSHLPTLSASAQLHVRVVMMHILDTHHHNTVSASLHKFLRQNSNSTVHYSHGNTLIFFIGSVGDAKVTQTDHSLILLSWPRLPCGFHLNAAPETSVAGEWLLIFSTQNTTKSTAKTEKTLVLANS